MKTRAQVLWGLSCAVIVCLFLLVFSSLLPVKHGRELEESMTELPAREMAEPPAEEMALPPPPPPPAEEMPRPAPTPVEDDFDAIDWILERMELGNIAYNAPKAMNVNETAIIELKLGLEKSEDELMQMIDAAGEREGARIRVSNRMEARLSGPNFTITAITREEQAVSRSEITEWRWEVKPISDGGHNLHLTLSAFVTVDGVSTPRVIRTFDKMIEVEVTWHQRVGSFFEKNWQWLWAAVLVPIVGWLWNRRKRAQPKVN